MALGVIGIIIPDQEANIAGIVVLSLAFVWVMSALINNFALYNNQLNRFEVLRAEIKQVVIYKNMQTELLKEFKNYLGEKYPELEKGIFDSITGEQSDVRVILKYPEIKSSKTLTKLTIEINNLAQKVYDQQVEIENKCARIRYFAKGKWEIIKPEIPADILEIIS